MGVRRLGDGFGSCRIATASGDEVMKMKNGMRMGKTADTLVDDKGVDEPLVSDDEGHYSQEEGVVTVGININ